MAESNSEESGPMHSDPALGAEPPALAEPVCGAVAGDTPGNKKGLWIEWIAVFILAWLPWMTWSLLTPGLIFSAETLEGINNAPLAVEGVNVVNDTKYILQETVEIAALLQILAPVLLIIWSRRREISLAEYGMVRPQLVRDFGGGLLMLIASLSVWRLMGWLPQEDYPDIFFFPAAAPGYAVMVVALTLNSIVEEVVWRGYMLQRLTLLTGSAGVAIFLSSLLFASYHLYQGPFSALSIFVWAIFFSIAWKAFGSLWPLIIGHTLNNILMFSLPGFE